MYKNYVRNMRYWKPQKGDEDYAKSVSSYPFVLIAFRKEGEIETKRIRIIVGGNYPNNKAEVQKNITKLTKGIPEEKFVLTVLFFKSENDWEKVAQLGKFKRHIKMS